ncbi:hypothetical protein SDJN02_09949, partial [Cucurbita argyrosperma subsp. argyrosperma]
MPGSRTAFGRFFLFAVSIVLTESQLAINFIEVDSVAIYCFFAKKMMEVEVENDRNICHWRFWLPAYLF